MEKILNKTFLFFHSYGNSIRLKIVWLKEEKKKETAEVIQVAQ